MSFEEALTFDDVLLRPGLSEILPTECSLETRLSRRIGLKIPLLSAAMDTVTEKNMAIAMAQMGGLGIIHRNMPAVQQAEEVRAVKRFESGMVVNPITITPHKTLGAALDLMRRHRIQGIPVIETDNRLVGILTHRDVRFARDMATPVSALMTQDNLVTVKASIEKEQAKELLHRHRIEKLLVVDDDGRCVGLITVKDIEKSQRYPDSCKDDLGRLRVGAALGASVEDTERAQALIAAGCDALVIDTAHAHSTRVLDQVRRLKDLDSSLDIIAGNVATAEGTLALIEAGVDGVKVGVGPGSICTTRIVAGVGVPQLSAILRCAEVSRAHGVPLIADGGITASGDFAKAIAAGADTVMVGSLLAGTEESPGETFLYQGRAYKAYRGMGSLGAMARGSADRYFQSHSDKFVPEGVEGRIDFKGTVHDVVYQLTGGLRAAMGYTGHGTIANMQGNCIMDRITNSGLKESHVHDVTVTKEAPNYRIHR